MIPSGNNLSATVTFSIEDGAQPNETFDLGAENVNLFLFCDFLENALDADGEAFVEINVEDLDTKKSSTAVVASKGEYEDCFQIRKASNFPISGMSEAFKYVSDFLNTASIIVSSRDDIDRASEEMPKESCR